MATTANNAQQYPIGSSGQDNSQQRVYRGRFAPSPSGPLHAGSLVAALGSYLDARAHQGSWLVRIEDIDPPREIPGAADIILRQLEAHGLVWDESVSWQSENSERYLDWLGQLSAEGLCYYCTCSRAQIKARGESYDGHCRELNRSASNASVRLINKNPVLQLQDRWHGVVDLAKEQATEDFILRRRDGLWAYQLAVVSDDYASGITDIVRGEDLLHASGWQLTLWQQFNQLNQLNGQAKPLPRLGHLPLVIGHDGRKLSKQNHAPAIANREAKANLMAAARALGLVLPHIDNFDSISGYLSAATETWQQNKLNTVN
ncbi:tRNA glutamyl-Q(34) synthetase GluQRS [Aliidiomarina shirensis]|uniref:Glutamyl-Q tRNA(Asp) synthetase n=1 Tax=Aliidiomarina shirensis TaxID=1048642 RepID=A0A432WRA6_9GAMM|nr:tRNA glutamyl-Q(34) synthetase GluQRS [Aliidiomarina shirensis]RUO36207.1 tRNA glutamyl-Q(34) synthetase GluQRS [Aliidiomarina shirensis]